KTLIISDVPSSLEKVEMVIAEIDIKPRQILIEAKLMEVNHDKLKDLGVDWGTGSSGAESDTVTSVAVNKRSTGGGTKINAATVGAQMLTSQVAPSVFIPKATGIDGTLDYDTGLELIFKKLTGTEFEIIIHALEEDVDTNTLSAPRIVTLNNQEAAILVGRKYPIVKEEMTAATGAAVTTHSLEEWLNYGIQLNVVPQICGVDEINMIVHPSITSLVTTLGGADVAYPILDIREAETQILMRDGETVVIGGLLKDVVKEGLYKVPFLGDIPLLGLLFQRKTHNTEKIDLLIFITAHIIKMDEFGNTASMPGIEQFEVGKDSKNSE
ncbi:MAG: type II secretion system protein GspD, partial [Candidatus Aureabacteria bacterium]|nr:type II secretion system protein GspD [Candidatus Auribacterota bacterium]